MASEVDICNLALAHLGDEANIAAISPPDGSAQAVWCSRFYPIARDSLLELHPWGFATRRSLLATFEGQAPSTWAYAYAMPGSWLKAIKVLDPQAVDDWSAPIDSADPMTLPASTLMPSGSVQGIYTPQPFVVESTDTGADVLFTNQANAVLQYTVRVLDPTKFSPLFVDTLAYFLASKLAGPLIKGAEGRQVAGAMLQTATSFLGRAQTSDASDRHNDIAPSVSWLVNR